METLARSNRANSQRRRIEERWRYWSSLVPLALLLYPGMTALVAMWSKLTVQLQDLVTTFSNLSHGMKECKKRRLRMNQAIRTTSTSTCDAEMCAQHQQQEALALAATCRSPSSSAAIELLGERQQASGHAVAGAGGSQQRARGGGQRWRPSLGQHGGRALRPGAEGNGVAGRPRSRWGRP